MVPKLQKNDVYPRLLNLNRLLKMKSHFLFGARSTGKTTLIQNTVKKTRIYDLLDDDVYQRLLRNPKAIGEGVITPDEVIVIDEVQRLPKLLNEVQRLMKSIPNKFLLTGSSARKLKQGGANLLGGRAWETHLHPLCSFEIPDFDLIKYLNRGGLPHIYASEWYERELKNYILLYLRQEILAEALTRNLEYFVSFLDTLALANGEELHFQNISNDSGVPARTIQNYVEVLNDTLLCFTLTSFQTKIRKSITRSKFFFFDLGVVNSLAQRSEIKPGSELFGKAFEHFIVREIATLVSYSDKPLPLKYWRSTSLFEVDLIIGKKWALEIKATKSVHSKHLKGLKAFQEEGLVQKYAVISQDPERRVIDGIEIWPWQEFLAQLNSELKL